MKPPEVIEATRLRLRLPKLEDASLIFNGYAQDPEIMQYWPEPSVEPPIVTLEDTKAFLMRVLEMWKNGKTFQFVIERKSDNALMGILGLSVHGHKCGLGYALTKQYCGLGFATEATTAITDWALAQSAIYRVWAIVHGKNATSIRVLEKCGFQREGVLRRWIRFPNLSTEPLDVLCYSKVK
jgi:ribosomal-protein-alanine N-acetyltransferase